MSILNVDKIQPVGGGSTITVDATDIQATSATITASSFVGGLPITNGADNRVITASSASAIQGEANLTFDGNTLALDSNTGTINVSRNSRTLTLEGNYGNEGHPAIKTSSGHDLRIFTSGNNERLRITSGGRFLLGTTASRTIAGHSPRFTLNGDDYSQATLQITSNQNGTSGTFLQFSHQRSGSAGGNTILQDDDDFGRIRFTGGDGTNIDSRGAEIIAQVDGTPGVDDMPGRLMFMTTADGAQSTTERLRIDSDGQVQIGSGTIHGGGHLTIRGGGVNTYATLDYQYVGTPSNNSTTLAQLRFTANTTGASVVQGAKIQAVSDAAWSATGDAPTRLEFHTSPDGSASMQERLRITSDGKFGFNDSDPDNDFILKCGTGAHTVMQVRSASESTKFTIQTVQDSDVRVGTVSDHPLNVYTNSLTRVHIHDDGWCMLNTSTLGSSKTAKELIIGYNNDGVSGGDQGRAGMTIRSGNNSSNAVQNGYIYFSDGTSGDNESKGGIVYEHSNDAFYFATNNTEKLRITSDGSMKQTSTGYFQVAKGTTAQRPSAVTGMIRYNTTTSKLEYYDGSAWQSIKTTFDGLGGNSTYTFGGYKVHVFTGNGNFTVTGAGSVDALIVAGGGGAGASSRNSYNGAWAGGGGGGGVLWQQSISVSSGTTYSIVVGNGGAVQNNGQNSTAFGYTAIGGGRGGGTTSAGSGNVNWNGASGGSGGGGLGDQPGPMQGGSGTSGQGNDGANGTDPGGDPNYEQGGGGGGAGEAGNTDGIGFGGDGRDMSGEFGTSVGENGYFGGGGAGGQGTDNSSSVNSGGLGGGGDSGGGYQNNSYASQAGQANTGGGGGAGGNATGGSGGQAGGSGIVLVRYAL